MRWIEKRWKPATPLLARAHPVACRMPAAPGRRWHASSAQRCCSPGLPRWRLPSPTPPRQTKQSSSVSPARSAPLRPISSRVASRAPPTRKRRSSSSNSTRPVGWIRRCDRSSRRFSRRPCPSQPSLRPAGHAPPALAPISSMPRTSPPWRPARTSAPPRRSRSAAGAERPAAATLPKRPRNPVRPIRSPPRQENGSATPQPISAASLRCAGATLPGPSAPSARP